MLHIILFILKIIGIVLLCILALFLLLLGIILFVPVRYRINASKYEEIHANIKVSWLLKILFVKVHYASEEEDFYYVVRVFGLPIIDSRRPKKIKKNKVKKAKPKKDKVKKTKVTREKSSKTKSQIKETNYTKNMIEENVIEQTLKDDTLLKDGISIEHSHEFMSNEESDNNHKEKHYAIEEQNNLEQNERVNINLIEDKENEKESFITKVINKIKNCIEKVKNFFCAIKKRIKKIKQSILNSKNIFINIKNKISLVKEFLTDEKNKEGIKCTFASLKKALKHILPYKIKGELKVGLDDPCNTGYMLGVLSLIYPIYEDRLKIVPDFEEQVLEGKIVAKGRILVFTLLRIGITLIFDKKFKILLKNVKELKEEL